jgi:hypothetical protein
VSTSKFQKSSSNFLVIIDVNVRMSPICVQKSVYPSNDPPL